MPATPMQSVNLTLGAGTLYAAPIGTAMPATIATALNAAFVKVGYTEDGHAWAYEITTEPIFVAEVIEPVTYENTKVTGRVQFAMAELIAANLKLAYNGGTVTTSATEATYDPPDAALPITPIMLAWESRTSPIDERIIWRRCFQAGPVEIKRTKAPAKATIPVAFQVVKPDNGTTKPFVHYLSLARG